MDEKELTKIGEQHVARTCPLKRATGDDILVFHNIDMTDETRQRIADEMNKGSLAISAATSSGEQYIGPAIGRCDEEKCGWWSNIGGCCSMTHLADIAYYLRRL